MGKAYKQVMVSLGDCLYRTATGFAFRMKKPPHLREAINAATGDTRREWYHPLSGGHAEAKAQAATYRAGYVAFCAEMNANGPTPALLRRLDEIRKDAEAQQEAARKAFFSRPRSPDDGRLDAVTRDISRKATEASAPVVAQIIAAIEAKAATDKAFAFEIERLGGARAAYLDATQTDGLATLLDVAAASTDAAADAEEDQDEAAALFLEGRQTRKARDAAKAEAAAAKAALAPVVKPAPKPETDAPDAIKAIEQQRRKKEGLEDETIRKQAVYLRRWIEIHGNTPVSQITKEQVRTYRDTVAELTATRAQLHVDELRTLPGPKLSAVAVNKHLAWIKAVLNWSADEGWIESNPADSLSGHKDKRSKEVLRQGFTNAQVRDIITMMDTKWKAANRKHVAFRWITLLVIYTGARVGEIGQLYKSDIIEVDGVKALRITDAGEGQSVKNDASIRTVPIPQRILDLGFLEFAASVKTPRLFAGIDTAGKKGEHFNYGDRASNALRDQILYHVESCKDANTGERDRRLSMHSFRHSWITAARRAKTHGYVARVLTGHKVDIDEHDAYGGSLEIPALKEAIDKVRPD